MVTDSTGVATGSAFLPGGTFMAGDSLQLVFHDGVTLGVSAGTSPVVAPVPLPAVGRLLLSALAGGGAGAAWKKRRKA